MFHVVDDTKIIRDILKGFLNHAGYEALLFCSAEEYIDYVNSDAFCLPVAVFTDIHMSGMNGYEMVATLSYLKPKLKFVIVTGEYGTPSEHIGKACMYLSKPFRANDFMRVVDSLVRCHRCAPADEYGCKDNDNRKKFPVGNWKCPHLDDASASQASGVQD